MCYKANMERNPENQVLYLIATKIKGSVQLEKDTTCEKLDTLQDDIKVNLILDTMKM